MNLNSINSGWNLAVGVSLIMSPCMKFYLLAIPIHHVIHV